MTCLYCGKKLGFFSRYKDTPFCSEEHLRQHQDELEKALMERLGSKAAQPAKPAAAKTAPALEKLAKPKPVAPAPVAEEKAPVPLWEEFFDCIPEPDESLDTKQPLVSPSSFAIIVQADCCTPLSSELERECEPQMADTEFELDPESVVVEPGILAVAPVAMKGQESFGEPWMFFPEHIVDGMELAVPEVMDLVALEYETEQTESLLGGIGMRMERELKPRLRLPMADRSVEIRQQAMGLQEETYPLPAATDYEPIPPREFALTEEQPMAAQIVGHFQVPLPMGEWLTFELAAESEAEPIGLSLVGDPNLEARRRIPELEHDTWRQKAILPEGSQARVVPAGFRARRQQEESGRQRPVKAVTFPALFQFSPRLPARPEVHVQ